MIKKKSKGISPEIEICLMNLKVENFLGSDQFLCYNAGKSNHGKTAVVDFFRS